MTIFESLKALRKNAGLSQVEVAKKLGMNRRSIAEMEAGGKHTLKSLNKYAALFNKRVEEGFILVD